jgi:hypothetical protein
MCLPGNRMIDTSVGFIAWHSAAPAPYSAYPYTGPKIVALCDLHWERWKSTRILERAGLPRAASYSAAKRPGRNSAA